MLRLLMAMACLLMLAACNNNTPSKIFKPDVLPSQSFAVNISKDTTLETLNGAIINIPAGSLESSDSVVQLEIKEAYHISEMLRAGLVTQSNGQPLSSGGMIFIDAKGENTMRITKPIKVSLPSNYADPNMQLFKGTPDENGNMNWVDPTNLPPTPEMARFDSGKALFISKCASCHGIGRDITGPDLAYISKKRDPHYLTEFVRNNMALMQSDDAICSPVARCVYEKWNRAPMNVFPELTDNDIKNIYDYIDNESSRLMVPFKPDGLQECMDSCRAYTRLLEDLNNKKEDLIENNDAQVNDTRQIPVTPVDTSNTTPIENFPRLVTPEQNRGVYYQFTIESFGWYNIDILLKSLAGTEETTLMVRIVGEYKTRLNVYLAVPSIRLLAPGGKMDGKKDEYAFFTPDGKIPLPVGSKAYIIVMGDSEENILFTKQVFTIDKSQQFNLTPATVTMEQINLQLRQMNFDQLNIRVAESKNAYEIRQTVKELKEAEKFKPKNCDCNCGAQPKDTIAIQTPAVES